MARGQVFWTPEKKAALRELAGTMSVDKLVEALGATSRATLQWFASHEGISLRLRKSDDPLPDETLSREGAALLIEAAAQRGKTPRQLVTSLIEIIVRESSLIDNILDED